MKSFRYIISAILACAIVMLSACSKEDILSTNEGQEVEVTFLPQLADDITTRAIGDGTKINQLKVVVYEATTNATLTKKIELEKSWSEAQKDGVALTLIEGRTYSILFWAQDSVNTAYSFGNSGNITVNYNDYLDGGFAKMEEMDAFCGTSTVTVGTDKIMDNGCVTLTRPLAQLNFADNTTKLEQGTHKAVVTFHSIPTSFNPFTGAVTMTDANDNADDITFTFTNFPGEELSANNTTYHYISCNYLFAQTTGTGTTSIEATLDLQKTDGTSLKRLEFKGQDAITLEKNKKTNVIGSIVQQPVTWSIWDGTVPTESTLTQDTNGRYIIDAAADIAWLTEYGATLDTNSTFVQTIDIDMRDIDKSIQLPAGSTYDGGGKTIKYYKNSLFGDATSLSVQNLIVDKITASSTTHVGVLVNTLKGSANFSNVTVTNSSATTNNGAAGGMVGYITNNGTENLEVTFTECTATVNTVSGSLASGVYVGRFRGYNNDEKLTFSADCNDSSATFGADAKAYYTTANAASWFTQEQMTAFGKYSGWLGSEEFYRGTVKYGNERFIPCWDGTTKIAPLTDGTTKLIYSAFDLASCAGTNPGTIKFMENVDLGAKVFQPLTNLSKLLGENKTIYNLKVETTFNTNSWDGGGFIRRCSAATIENITFQDADVKVTHVEGSDGDAYASIVCGTAEGTNTMTNVKVIGGKLYGCNKMGGIAGYITGTFTATNCVVDGLSIENYDSGGKDSFGFKANGEVGGAFGFIAANSTISGCYVKNTTLNCSGVNNGRVLTLFKYAGRHVNEFIGDIRTTSGQKITITYDETQFTGNTYKNRKDQYSGCKYIGHCYYTSINAVIAKIEDTKGSVSVNGKSITVAKNY